MPYKPPPHSGRNLLVGPHQQIFENLVNINAIKSKIVNPVAISPKKHCILSIYLIYLLPPCPNPRDFWKKCNPPTITIPHPGFSNVCIYILIHFLFHPLYYRSPFCIFQKYFFFHIIIRTNMIFGVISTFSKLI